MSGSELILCERLGGGGTLARLAFAKKGATEVRITGRVFRDSGRTLRDRTRVFEPAEEEL